MNVDWCYEGRWYPPQCINAGVKTPSSANSLGCVEAYHPTPMDTQGWVEQNIVNSNLKIVLAYTGKSNINKVIKEITESIVQNTFSTPATAVGVLYFIDAVSDTHVMFSSISMRFPTHIPGCFDNNGTPTGTTLCQFPAEDFLKSSNPITITSLPDAYLLASRVKITSDELQNALSLTIGGGTLTMEAAACNFLTNNEDKKNKWIDGIICNAGYHVSVSAQKCVPKCPGGSVLNSELLCEKCPVGTYKVAESLMEICVPCADGSYTSEEGGASCVPCPTGQVRSKQVELAHNATVSGNQCFKCSGGEYASQMKDACYVCAAGYYSEVASDTCSLCSSGSYSAVSGSIGCILCPETKSTLLDGASTVNDCTCMKDTYLDKIRDTCTLCTSALNCTGGDDPPLIAMGYVASPLPEGDDYMSIYSVYQCSLRKGCPGGMPNTCYSKRKGLACGKCEYNHYQPHANQPECIECGDYDMIWISIAIAVLFLFVGGVIYLASTSKASAKATIPLMITTSLSMVIDSMLTLSTLGSYQMEWPDFVKAIMAAFKFLLFDFSIMKIGCITGGTLVADTAMMVFAPALLWVSVFIWYFITKLMAEPVSRMLPNYNNYNNYIARKVLKKLTNGPMTFDGCINSCGLATSVLYLGMVRVAIEMFNCYTHPNGVIALRSHPHIVCYGPEWMSALPIAILAILLYVGGVNGFLLWCIAKGPQLVNHPRWSKRLKFLFIRFRPEVYYWTLMLQTRSTLISLPVAILPDKPVLQAIFAFNVLIASLVFTSICMPWSHKLNSLLDVSLLSVAIFLIVTGNYFSITKELEYVASLMESVPSTAMKYVGVSPFLSNLSLAIICIAAAGALISTCISCSYLFYKKKAAEDRHMSCVIVVDKIREISEIIKLVPTSEITCSLVEFDDLDRERIELAFFLVGSITQQFKAEITPGTKRLYSAPTKFGTVSVSNTINPIGSELGSELVGILCCDPPSNINP
eukprot:GHVR01105236.1.p1 GENE.GHVR01105236.1~~GHVR01105236.1.p1  ORF type:complete len:1145 (+),score=237.14 GHVR01105236.1:503-3436(+)